MSERLRGYPTPQLGSARLTPHVAPEVVGGPAARAQHTGGAPSPAPAVHQRSARVAARWIFAVILALNVLGGGSLWTVSAIITTQRASADLKVRVQHIQALARSRPLTQAATLSLLRTELGGAEEDLRQLDGVLPFAAIGIPGPETRAHAALRMGVETLDAAQSGISVAIALLPGLSWLAQSVTHPSATPRPTSDAHPLTIDEIHTAQAALHAATAAWQQAQAERQRFSPSDLHLLHADIAAPALQRLDSLAPTITVGIDLVAALVDGSPTVLGLTAPENFLLLNMDSDELRPTGGFLGNYAVLTLAQDALTSGIHLHDVYTLDCPHLPAQPCPERKVPTDYAWFPLAQNHFGLRDSNLDPDLPTSAWITEQALEQEGGPRVDGIIAITPALMQDVLRTIGPVVVPRFQVTVTADNLRDRLHYYHQNAQITTALGISPQVLGTSAFKVFDVLLAQAVMARLSTLTSAQQATLVTALVQACTTKNIQFFFNNQRIEHALEELGVAGHVVVAPGDSLYVVDTNDGGSYANADVAEQIADTVNLDATGGAWHSLAITYTYRVVQHLYAQSDTFANLVRVIVPNAAEHGSSTGPCAAVRVTQAYHVALACQISLRRGATATVHFTWYVPSPSAPRHGPAYTLLVQRQPGASAGIQIVVNPPPKGTFTSVAPPAQLVDEQLRWSANPLLQDTLLSAG